MKLRVETTSRGSVEQNFAGRVEQRVREQACRESGALSYAVSIERTADGGARVEVRRVMPAKVPDMVRRFVGDDITVEQVERWGPPGPTGTRTATVEVTVKGQPASMTGSMVLSPDGPDGAGCTELVTGEVTVAIPFLGRRIEPEIVKVIEAALRIDHRVGQAWVSRPD
ncbi:DUF2505 domain-containing protein [Jatrophihabitans sp.]|uniref:DUF2505 domain-containing protein n=1 Tax=Jatrophihabitans sp. TaxID=1932789 RepID=UPI002B6FEC7A|nr:DUF2505 domain-containing protein [Jatrophihabitans sp.]